MEKDFLPTVSYSKSEKSKIQSESISELLSSMKLVSEDLTYIEFGAGKGGLSYTINSLSNSKTTHILLEREGIRNKKDRYGENLIRFRTDIQHFNINYLDKYFEEKKTYGGNLFGIAKHICGCGLDLSLKCLLNYKERSNVMGLCLATCCHHRCDLNILVNREMYTKKCLLSLKEISLIIKGTSWIFGPINVESKTDFQYKGYNKRYFGMICKFIIDLGRCFYMIENGFDVLYLKYIGNEVTPENNVILALNPSKYSR